MNFSKRCAVSFALAGGLLAASSIGLSAGQVDRVQASAVANSDYETCRLDLYQVCRETTPVGPDLVQCFADARATCAYLYGEP